MSIEPGEKVAVFRTDGGLYVSAEGRAGKACSLRFNPYGRIRHNLEPADLFEMVYTRYGRRYRPVAPEDVKPGTHLAIRGASGYNVVTSLIQEVYLGPAVVDIEGDGNFLVFDDSRASLVFGGAVLDSVPLLREGWRGAPETLWSLREGDQETIIQIEVTKTWIDDRPRLEEDVPGWNHFLDDLDEDLQELSGVEVASAWCFPDGALALRLENVPPPDGDGGREVLRLVRQAEKVSQTICVQCGESGAVAKVAGINGEPFSMPLCPEHALERWSDEAQDFPVPDWAHLPANVDTDTIRVDPGWWGNVSGMINEVQELATIREIGVAQVDGELIVQLQYGSERVSDAEAKITRIVERAQAEAETTCEHCGKPGKRTTTPWIHICCGECPVTD